MTDTKQIPGLADAEAQLARAEASRDKLAARLEAAESTLKEAQAARSAVVRRIAAGEDLAGADVGPAEEKIRTAQAQVAALKDAMAEPDAAILRAKGRVAKAIERHGLRRRQKAIEERIELAEEADELGRALADWQRRWLGNGAKMSDCLATCPGLGLAEMEDLRGNRHMIAFLPASMQLMIVQTGSVVTYTVADRTKSTWAPPLADARRRLGEAS